MIINKSFEQGSFPDGNIILRSTHLDHLSLVPDINPAGKKTSHSFLYRTHLSWNRLPLSLCEEIRPSVFKMKLIQYIWKEIIAIELDSVNAYSDPAICKSLAVELSLTKIRFSTQHTETYEYSIYCFYFCLYIYIYPS